MVKYKTIVYFVDNPRRTAKMWIYERCIVWYASKTMPITKQNEMKLTQIIKYMHSQFSFNLLIIEKNKQKTVVHIELTCIIRLKVPKLL